MVQSLVPEHPKITSYVSSVTIRVQRWFVNFRWRSYSTLNCLKWIRNNKVMRFESRRGQNEEKCGLQFRKTYFPHSSFLVGPLALHLQDDL
jgi:hypothetical protein